MKKHLKKETVFYRGIKFRRYPDSRHHYGHSYFAATISLHRLKWLLEMGGSIPDGMDIHHKDGDPGNNDISNLQLMDKTQHRCHHLHSFKMIKSECIFCGKPFESGHFRKLACSTECRLEWNNLRFCPNKRIKWEKKTGNTYPILENPDSRIRTCKECGKEFAIYKKGQMFCSDKCGWTFHNTRAKERRRFGKSIPQ